jgi:GH24 family phage-related lysozyme (muramidase)
MKISQRGIDLIKEFEGCKLTAYKDAVGVWTIAYGHTKNVKQGMKITQEQAEELLKKDLAEYEAKVEKYDKYNWNQNQFDALVSFAYNIGSIDQLTSNGRRAIKTISEKILEYNKAGGKTLEGLVRRRKAEKKLFDEPVEADLSGGKIESVNSSADSEKEQEKPASEVRSPYIVGQTYTIKVKTALNVRKGAGKSFGLVGYNKLTQDGKNHSNGGSALKNGTRVAVQEVKVISDTEVWIKIPSGWVCAIDGGKKHIV